MRIKVNYIVGGYSKFVDGELIEETPDLLKVKGRAGEIFEISKAKDVIVEVIRFEDRRPK